METATRLNLELAMSLLLGLCRSAKRVPVAWMMGPGLRADFSEWQDTQEQSGFLGHPAIVIEDGAMIMCGLPVFPMVAEGMALRTVAKQIKSGFD